jgi:hypothetical protein
MVDTDTFLTTLYVMRDEYCKSQWPAQASHPGPHASLSRSEVVTLAVFGQWNQFKSERDFYRYAHRHLRAAFPSLPAREQFNRLMREHRDVIVAFGLFLVRPLRRNLASTSCWIVRGFPLAMPSVVERGGCQDKRILGGVRAWAGMRVFHLLCAITPQGVITGFGFGSASTHDQRLAETFFAARAQPLQALSSVGAKAVGVSIGDKGFAGEEPHTQWRECSGAEVITPPHQRSKQKWPKEWRRWLARLRQIVETIYDKLLNTFRLARERPHELTGFQARLAAKVSLHNFCIWLNLHLGRPSLAFVDLLDW